MLVVLISSYKLCFQMNLFLSIFRMQRCLKDINKLLQAQGNTFWPASKITSLDRALAEIIRHLEAKVSIYFH